MTASSGAPKGDTMGDPTYGDTSLTLDEVYEGVRLGHSNAPVIVADLVAEICELRAEVERRVTPEAIREAISEAHTHGWRSPHGLVGLFDVTPESAEPVPVDHERLISADLLAARLLEEE